MKTMMLIALLAIAPMALLADRATDIEWIKFQVMTAPADRYTGQEHVHSHGGLSQEAADTIHRLVKEGQSELMGVAKRAYERRCQNSSIFSSVESLNADSDAIVREETVVKRKYIDAIYAALSSKDSAELRSIVAKRRDPKIGEKVELTEADLPGMHTRACEIYNKIVETINSKEEYSNVR